jgi:hypothetical protein
MYTYSTHGNIRTRHPLERAYTDRNGNYLAFIILLNIKGQMAIGMMQDCVGLSMMKTRSL